MNGTISTPPKRVFIIGPMSTSDNDPQGLPLSQHIPNIARATRMVLNRLGQELGAAMPECMVIEPPNYVTDIPEAVFSHIMHCDLAIADISTGSPNVLYELALLHANGVPVILIGEPPFYLTQMVGLIVEDFQSETLFAALAGGSFDEIDLEKGDERVPGQIERLILKPSAQQTMNPFSRHFGGVHLVNVAAATGVATGYYYNFIRWVLREGTIFYDRPEFEDLVIIRPRRISEVNHAMDALRRDFGEPRTDRDGNPEVNEDGSPQYELPGLTYLMRGHARHIFFRRVGKHIVDYPTPISSLTVSRQHRQMMEYARIRSREEGKELDPLLSDFEERMIGIFFETLEQLVNDPASGCDHTRMKIMSADQAREYFES